MKKMYISPAMEVASKLAPEEMLAVSQGKFEEPMVPGPEVYSKKNDWNIFDGDAVEE